MATPFDLTAAGAHALDRADPLSAYVRRFHKPLTPSGEPAIYFAGNSLGLQSDAALAEAERLLGEWRLKGVKGWFSGDPAWVRYDQKMAERSAALVGAHASEVSVSGTLTGNLHALMASFYHPTPGKHRVVVEGGLFPSDRYAIASQARWHGCDPESAVLEVPPSSDHAWSAADFEAALDRHEGEIALVLVAGINYYTGQVLPIREIAAAARRRSIPIGVDLAHATGNIPLSLHDDNVDFAAWCGYKYLNGGPGAPAALFVHERHHHADLPRLEGWWGHRLSDRFKMDATFRPALGADAWQISTPSLLALAPLAASLALFEEVGFDRLETKSKRLTAFLDAALRERLAGRVEIVTPDARGAQLSLRIRRDGKAAFERLQQAGVICDWREPDAIRVAPTPFYNTFSEVWHFVDVLADELG